ncbi:MAG: energy transducer TonB [Sphingomonadales bacterium]|nr:energy transducer TonB [Sphingomonadales bacterium]
MRVVSIAAMAGVLLSSANASAKTPPIELKRVGKWEVNYDQDSCHLLGKFGEGSSSIIMRLTRYEPNDTFDMRFFGEPVRYYMQFPKVAYTFDPNATPKPFEAMVGAAGNLPMADFGIARLIPWPESIVVDAVRASGDQSPVADRVVPPSISVADERKVSSLTITAPSGKRYKLLLGPMDGPFAAMRACTTNLVQSWGYDPATQAALKSRPMPKSSPGTWMRPNDYPVDMLERGASGIVRFRLDVDERGGMSNCHILAHAGDDDFANTTCKILMKRGQFDPAIDAAGQATKGYFVSAVRWSIGH